MSSQKTYQAKEFIASARDISNSMKQVQSDLLLLIDGTVQVKDVLPNLEEFTNSMLIELQTARGTIANSLEMVNNIYLEALNAIKTGENHE
ncbi:MAG: hypothetical protein QM500_11210 [Methylococcales bacterium]